MSLASSSRARLSAAQASASRPSVRAWQSLRIRQLAAGNSFIAARCQAEGAAVVAEPAAAPLPSGAAAASQPAAADPSPAAPAAQPAAAPEASISALDIRVGAILSCERHPDADSLYVEQVDVGEPEPRTIVSGLVKFVPLEQLAGRRVVVLANLKARNMRGIKSHGMLLCASNDAHDQVEPLTPPEGAPVGERVWFGEQQQQAAPAEPNRVQKKKLWEALQPDLKTGVGCVAAFKGAPAMTSAGPITAPSLAGAHIS